MASAFSHLIINGPSKWNLATNFFTELDKRHEPTRFTIVPNVSPIIIEESDKEELELQIMKVEIIEAGWGESIVISGYAWRQSKSWKFNGAYRWKGRQGEISFKAN